MYLSVSAAAGLRIVGQWAKRAGAENHRSIDSRGAGHAANGREGSKATCAAPEGGSWGNTDAADASVRTTGLFCAEIY